MENEIRLIDANALLKAIEYEYDLNYGETLLDPIKFADMVEDAPTVDAVPVVHGRWISLSTLWGEKSICSVCGRDLYVNEPGNGLPNIEDLHYCPNCGAKIDGDWNG